MADYRSEMYEVVDQQFQTMLGAKDQFSDELLLEDPTPYERAGIPMEPTGWVENSDPDIDGAASVLIDSDGITILNGKIFLSDPGGNSVLGPAGFDGSWIGFLYDKFYNSAFAYGTTGVIADSLVGTASTAADYLASLSTELPYWIVDVVSGSGSPELVTDAAASGGKALKFGGAANDAMIFQDVPVLPGRRYRLLASWKYANSGGSSFNRYISLSWRDSTHAIIGSAVETGLNFTTSQAAYASEVMSGAASPTTAPANAAYLRVGFEISASGTNASATLNSVRLAEAVLEGINTLKFGTGSAAISIVENSGAFDFDADINVGRIRLTDTTDASNSSTGHAFQIGSSGGDNIIADNNEIMALSNGSAAILYLNKDGGADVRTGGGLTVDGGITASSSGIGAIDMPNGGGIVFTERSDPAAPSANAARFYCRDNGAGKTQIVVRFATGAIQVIATQP